MGFERVFSVIKVIGVGGAGGNIINAMTEANLRGVEFIAVNTDARDLRRCKAEKRIQIGESLTKGLGTGGNPRLGWRSAQEHRDELREIVEGADIVFITAGLGGGTGTGASPVLAELAKDAGALTVAIVTKPFEFEGRIRQAQAEMGIKELLSVANAVIVIPNQSLFEGEKLSVIDISRQSDDVFCQAVKSISDLVNCASYIIVDLQEISSIMSEGGYSVLGIGKGSGEERAYKSAQDALSSRFIGNTSIQNAKGLLVSITGDKDTSLDEVNEVMSVIHGNLGSDTLVIFGLVIDESLDDIIKVTLIATGV